MTNVIHNSYLIFGKNGNPFGIIWNVQEFTFCSLKLYSQNKFCKQKLFAVLHTYLLKALWLRSRSSLQYILLKQDWQNHFETGWAKIHHYRELRGLAIGETGKTMVLSRFYGKWNYIALHEHYNLVSIKAFFLTYLV